MSILLEIRDYIQKFYQKYAAVLNVILRFLAAFITFFATNRVIGFNPYLDHTYTELVFAAVSVVFPTQILLFFEAVFIILHILYVSHYLAFVTAIFFAILYFVYVRFIPKDGYVILSMPVLSSFGAPYILPILLGITADPIAIIPESIGVIVYHYLQNVISVVSTSTEDSINLYHLVLKQTFNDKELYITLIVFSIVTIFVYFIRNSKIDYSFEIAIISGGFLNTILLLFMNFFMDININAMYNTSKAVTIYMKKQGYGVILNTSSMVSKYGQPSGIGYPTSKFAVNGFTLSLARELASYNIRVNAVAPGITNTDMVKKLPQEMIEPLIKSIPLGRIGEPKDIANAYLFLASDMASYITGVILSVDGLARS